METAIPTLDYVTYSISYCTILLGSQLCCPSKLSSPEEAADSHAPNDGRQAPPSEAEKGIRPSLVSNHGLMGTIRGHEGAGVKARSLAARRATAKKGPLVLNW